MKSTNRMAFITLFAIIAVFGLSVVTGNNQQSNIGTSLASAQEPADINNDNIVNIFDLSTLLSKWNTNDATSDLNKDGIVNIFDLSTLLSKWGAVGGMAQPPQGVTLTEADGGTNYYAQWENTIPSDPNFFPIAAFSGYDLDRPVAGDRSKIQGHKDKGINTYVNLANGTRGTGWYGGTTDIEIIRRNNMYAFANPSQENTDIVYYDTYGDSLAGWVYQDEADGTSDCSFMSPEYDYLVTTPCTIGNYTKVNPDILLNMTNNLKNIDNTHPVLQAYTNAYAMSWYPGGPVSKLAQAADIIVYDIYPLVDRRSTFGGKFDAGHVWAAHQSVTQARINANYAKPIWPAVETSATDTNSGMNTTGYRPTPADIRALVWNYIIGGARGITYFNHCFCTSLGSSTHDDLNETFNQPQAQAIAEVNAQIKSLAAVINASFANGYVTTNLSSSDISTMAKWHSGAGYIFAIPHSSGAKTVQFSVAGQPNGIVEVLFENRTIPIVNGQFTDTFADEYTNHIYKVMP